MARSNRGPQQKKTGSLFGWQNLAICMTIILIPWALYVNYHPRFNDKVEDKSSNLEVSSVKGGAGFFLPMATVDNLKESAASITSSLLNRINHASEDPSEPILEKTESAVEKKIAKNVITTKSLISTNDLPLLGPIPTAG